MGEYIKTKVKQVLNTGEVEDFELMQGKYTIGFAAMLYHEEDLEELILTTTVGKALSLMSNYLKIIKDVKTPIAKRIQPVVQYFSDYLSNFSNDSIITSNCYCLEKNEILNEVNSFKKAFEKIATKKVIESKKTCEIVNQYTHDSYIDSIDAEKFFKNELKISNVFVDRVCKFNSNILKYNKEFFFIYKEDKEKAYLLTQLRCYHKMFPYLDKCLSWKVSDEKHIIHTFYVM